MQLLCDPPDSLDGAVLELSKLKVSCHVTVDQRPEMSDNMGFVVYGALFGSAPWSCAPRFAKVSLQPRHHVKQDCHTSAISTGM